ncbi:STAS domain-containing protein [Hoyosella rhizosphaerae]|nr:STAS domain-containing protein [Hoyosella rhizosphaerae]MBN4927589.1 STAS domain-containing protein [Hoyosella rhizosphaerae]
MSPLLVTSEHTSYGATVVRITGDVDIASVSSLRSQLESDLFLSDGVYVFDLTAVSFLGSAGIRALADITTLLRKRGGHSAVVGNPSVRHILCAVGFDEELNLQRTVADAVLSLSQSFVRT